MPDYPATKDSQSLKDPGILHFIHCPTNPIPEGTQANKMSRIFTKEMSRVSLINLFCTCLIYLDLDNSRGTTPDSVPWPVGLSPMGIPTKVYSHRTHSHGTRILSISHHGNSRGLPWE
jgi:hypothetical protein